MRKFIATLVATSLLALSAGPALAEETPPTPQLNIYLENHLLDLKQPAKLLQNRTMIGFRDYFEATDVSVSWDAASREALVELPNQTILIRPDRGELIVNGSTRAIDVPPQIINDRIYLPLRALAETMGYGVRYQAQANGPQLVFLTYAETPPVPGSPEPTQPAGDRLTLKLPTALDGEQVLGYNRTKDALRQVVALSDRVIVRTIPFNGGDVTVAEEALPAGTKATGLSRSADGTPVVTLQPLKPETTSVNGSFVGVGLPTGFDSYTSVKTSKGTFPYYVSAATDQVMALTDTGLEVQTVQREGYAFDVETAVGATREDIKVSVTDNGTYVMRLNKQLVLIRPTEGEARRVPYDRTLNGTDMTVIGNRIYTWGLVDKKLFVEIIDSDGDVLRPYTEVSRLDRDVNELRLMNSDVVGHTFAFLLNDYFRAYLVTWNADNGASTLKIFPKGVAVNHLVTDETGAVQGLAVHDGEATIFLQ